MTIEDKSCGNCEHWEKTGEGGQGICTRFPPMPIMLGMQETPQIPGIVQKRVGSQPIVHSFFPAIKAIGKCGEWAAADEAVMRARQGVLMEGLPSSNGSS